MFTIPAMLKLLQAIGPIAARLPEFKSLFDQIVGTFKGHQDQATLKQAYQDLMDENTGGHARLQEKLRIAERDVK